MPKIEQLVVKTTTKIEDDQLERKLYLIRKTCEKQIESLKLSEELKSTINREFYICSWSSRTLIYKGMLLVDQLRKFYPDLSNKNFTSAFGLVHL